jgi:hypothetical protein
MLINLGLDIDSPTRWEIRPTETDANENEMYRGRAKVN